MDRLITYPGQLIDHHDPMLVNHFAMIGLGKLAQAVFGDQPLVRGLACEPTAPASLQVQLMPGEIYNLQNIDSTPYGDLPPDTQHTIVKQGTLLESKLLDCPAPAIEGHSVTHLVQVSLMESDAEKDLLPYYNASNPQQVWWGPENEGKTQSTVRRGLCQAMLKAGISAPTGNQQQPAVDIGYVGLYTITVAHGQTAINAEHIRRIENAPFIDETLTQKLSQAAADQRYLQIKVGDGRYLTPEQGDKRYLKPKEADDRYLTPDQGDSRYFRREELTFPKLHTGWQALPSGFIWQWGFVEKPTFQGVKVTYPIAFPHAVLSLSATNAGRPGSGIHSINVVKNGKEDFQLYCDFHGEPPAIDGYWLALGY